MLSRRDLFRAFFALPVARLLAPLAKLLPAAAPVVVANTRRATFMGAKAARLAMGPPISGFLVLETHPNSFAHPERYGTVTIPKYPNPTRRVSVEGGPVLWEAS